MAIEQVRLMPLQEFVDLHSQRKVAFWLGKDISWISRARRRGEHYVEVRANGRGRSATWEPIGWVIRKPIPEKAEGKWPHGVAEHRALEEQA